MNLFSFFFIYSFLGRVSLCSPSFPCKPGRIWTQRSNCLWLPNTGIRNMTTFFCQVWGSWSRYLWLVIESHILSPLETLQVAAMFRFFITVPCPSENHFICLLLFKWLNSILYTHLANSLIPTRMELTNPHKDGSHWADHIYASLVLFQFVLGFWVL